MREWTANNVPEKKKLFNLILGQRRSHQSEVIKELHQHHGQHLTILLNRINFCSVVTNTHVCTFYSHQQGAIILHWVLRFGYLENAKKNQYKH